LWLHSYCIGLLSSYRCYNPLIPPKPPPTNSLPQTASLVAASCRSSAVFSGMTLEVKEAMYDYGKHLGLAFQVGGGGGRGGGWRAESSSCG